MSNKRVLKRKIDNYFAMCLKWTTGSRLIELQKIIDYATEVKLPVDGDVLMLHKIYTIAERRI